VSLVCRYLRTVLLKYPPQHWRVIRLCSVEKLTADNMTEFIEYERMQGCCRLELGCVTSANMFRDKDLIRVFAEMSNLSSLKLIWSHLLRSRGFEMAQGLPGALRLRELRLHKCQADGTAIVAACPNLTHLGLSDCDVINGVQFFRLQQLKRLILINSGSLKFFKGCTALTHLWVDPAPFKLQAFIARMPDVRVIVSDVYACKMALPRVAYYYEGNLMPPGEEYCTANADWDLLPKA
jgi:hypothetical protein